MSDRIDASGYEKGRLIGKDLREFIECLNANEVEYLVVGAPAVSWHGSPRYSAEISFRANAVNADRVIRAIRQFGFGSMDIGTEDLLLPGRVIQRGQEPARIDLPTSITGVEFEDAWSTHVEGTIDMLAVNFIGLKELPRNKAGREGEGPH